MPLRIVMVGHVDHGKSTLLGRLLYDTHSLPEETRKSIYAIGEGFEFSSLLDVFREEQAQNITIETTQISVRTALRDYVMIDAPGHREFLKNMITGASSAVVAILLIDVTEGIKEQTRGHARLLSVLGIRKIIIAINKMDRVDYSQEVFKTIMIQVTALLLEFGLFAQEIIPMVATQGINVVISNQKKMLWYQGMTLLKAMEAIETPLPAKEGPLRLVVQDVYCLKECSVVVGRIESGVLHIGEEIIFWPGGQRACVRSFESWTGSKADFTLSAEAGEAVALTLEISKGKHSVNPFV
ncbi:MAG TPA: GTP-binding protein, partial [Chthoniobacterales bacterium]|nr:GTP-binding protein [Chthoniobacterales bacterium]